MSDRAAFGSRRLLEVCLRSLPLLAPVAHHIAAFLFLAGGLGATAAFFAIALGFDALWEGVLQGSPLQARTALLLGLDPAVFSAGASEAASAAETAVRLSEESRAMLRNRLVFALGGAIALVLPIGGALIYYQLWILQRINQHLRTRMIERLQSLSLRFHAGAQVGDAIYRVYQDSAMVTSVIRTLILLPAVRMVFLVAMAALVAVQVDVGLVLLLFGATLPLTLALAWYFSKPLRAGFLGAREANSALMSRIQESLSAVKLIKAFRAESLFEERFERASREAFARAFEARNRLMFYSVTLFWVTGSVLAYAILVATQNTMAQLGLVTAVAWVGLASARTWNLGVLTTFQQSGRRVTSSIEQLLGLWGLAQDVASGLDRVFALLDAKPEVADRPDAVALSGVRRGIAFEDVSFAYQSDRPVLDGVSFEAPLGTLTALVGPTGAGKSTLLALLLRLYDPGSGSVRVDGRDLRELQLASLRAHVSIGLQENLLFANTIRENIRYAMPHATDAQVESAAHIACAHEFIMGLPDGYDTLLGERGAKLSLGQRQRIGIARALLKDAPVLILDEPTASLDVETEQMLMRNLALWGRDRTLLIVTHRLDTVRRADQILVLREGRIVERGTHAELERRRGGLYQGLSERSSAQASDLGAGSGVA